PAAPAAPAAEAGDEPTSAAGMLALAQRLHDEYVNNGKQEGERILHEARTEAERIVREAEEQHNRTLAQLEQERSLLERKIDELRVFERDYRTRLKRYLESLLADVDGSGNISGRADAGPAQFRLSACPDGGGPSGCRRRCVPRKDRHDPAGPAPPDRPAPLAGGGYRRRRPGDQVPGRGPAHPRRGQPAARGPPRPPAHLQPGRRLLPG